MALRFQDSNSLLATYKKTPLKRFTLLTSAIAICLCACGSKTTELSESASAKVNEMAPPSEALDNNKAANNGKKLQRSHFDIEVLWRNNQCQHQQAQLVELKNKTEAEQWIKTPSLLEAPKLTLPNKNNRLLLGVAMGQKTSGGFALELKKDSAELIANTLLLPIEFNKPDPNAMVTMALTSPCMLLAVDLGDEDATTASFESIKIQGQNDLVLSL